MNLIALANATLTRSEAEEIRRAVRLAKASGELGSLVAVIAGALEVERASTVADMDHLYSIGVLLRSVVDDDKAVSDAFKRLGLRTVPGGVAFRGGLDGKTFDNTYAEVQEAVEQMREQTGMNHPAITRYHPTY